MLEFLAQNCVICNETPAISHHVEQLVSIFMCEYFDKLNYTKGRLRL